MIDPGLFQRRQESSGKPVVPLFGMRDQTHEFALRSPVLSHMYIFEPEDAIGELQNQQHMLWV